MKKHIFIFNGNTATGKSILGRLLNTNDCIVIDDYYNFSKFGIRELSEVIFNSDKYNIIIICNATYADLEFLSEIISEYCEVCELEKPNISCVKFSKME